MKIDNEELRTLLKCVKERAASALENQPDDAVESAARFTRAIREIGEMVGAAAVCAMAAVLMVLWCAATPDQASAECDLAAAEMEVAE